MHWKNMFPDWEELAPGTWSGYGEIIHYESKDFRGREIEVGLYREPDDGSYTLQIFCNDDVVFCENVYA